MKQHVVMIHPDAPAKPPVGAACNGCGVCCLAEPCPVGMVLSLRLSGPCRMLAWEPASSKYRCRAVQPATKPDEQTWRGRARIKLSRWAARWIAAGQGCDATIEAERPPNTAADADRPRAERR